MFECVLVHQTLPQKKGILSLRKKASASESHSKRDSQCQWHLMDHHSIQTRLFPINFPAKMDSRSGHSFLIWIAGQEKRAKKATMRLAQSIIVGGGGREGRRAAKANKRVNKDCYRVKSGHKQKCCLCMTFRLLIWPADFFRRRGNSVTCGRTRCSHELKIWLAWK